MTITEQFLYNILEHLVLWTCCLSLIWISDVKDPNLVNNKYNWNPNEVDTNRPESYNT